MSELEKMMDEAIYGIDFGVTYADKGTRMDTCGVCQEQFPVRMTEPVKPICHRCQTHLHRLVKWAERQERIEQAMAEEARYVWKLNGDGTATKVRKDEQD